MRDTNAIASLIFSLLDGEQLIAITSTPLGVHVRQWQRIESIASRDGSNLITIVDSYGVLSTEGPWRIEPNDSIVSVTDVNGDGEPLYFAWVVMRPTSDNTSARWCKFDDAANELYRLQHP